MAMKSKSRLSRRSSRQPLKSLKSLKTLKPSPEFEGVYKLASLISIVLFAYLLTFLYKLEKTGCECAKDWRRTFIIGYCIYTILLAAAQFFNMNYRGITFMLAPISFALSIMFIVFTLQYVHRLKREKCSCSDEMGRAVLYIVAAIDASVFAIVGLMIIINALLFMFMTSG